MSNGRMVFTNDIKWTHSEGEVITGVLLGISNFRTQNGVVKLWIIDTGDGVEQHVFNDSIYDMTKHTLRLGSKIEVTYYGKKDLDDNKSMKIFNVNILELNSAGDTIEKIDTGDTEDTVNGGV